MAELAQTQTLLVALNMSAKKRGGTEVYLEHLASGARDAGVQVVVAFADVGDQVRARLQDAGATVLTFGQGPELIVAARLQRLAHQHRVNVALLHFFRLMSPVSPALAARGTRVIYVDDHSGSAAHRGLLAELGAFAAHRALARALHRIVAVSDFVRRRLLASGHMRDDEVVRVYNGVRQVEAIDGARRAASRGRLGVGEDRLLLVAAGNLIREKGFDVLLEAMSGSARWSLRIAGEGPELGHLQKLAADRGVDARFLGRRDDVPELMACADVVAVPSVWHEAFGFTVAEAMRAGRPVVASNIGGIPELIEDGRTGILVPAGNSAQLRSRLRQLSASPALRARLGAAAAVDAGERFGVERMARQMLEQVQGAMYATA
jgi:glycosyltransferase involved in cell wall biosynthesis